MSIEIEDLLAGSNMDSRSYRHLLFSQFNRSGIKEVFSAGGLYALDEEAFSRFSDDYSTKVDKDWVGNGGILEYDMRGRASVFIFNKGFKHTGLGLPNRSGIKFDLYPGIHVKNFWDDLLSDDSERVNYLRSHLLETFNVAVNELGAMAYGEFKKGNILPYVEIIDGVPELTSIPFDLQVTSNKILAHDVLKVMFPEDAGYKIEVENTYSSPYSSQLHINLKYLPHETPTFKWKDNI
jgi:hypothetical protein